MNTQNNSQKTYRSQTHFGAGRAQRYGLGRGRALLGVALGLGVMGLSSPARAKARNTVASQSEAMVAKGQKSVAQCTVVAIHASKKAPAASTARVPAELSAFGAELQDDQFAAFKSFHLLEQQSSPVRSAKRSALNFRSGYSVGLKLVKKQGERLKVHVDLAKKGGRSLVDLDYWMRSGGHLLLVGGNFKDGKVIFATQCRG